MMLEKYLNYLTECCTWTNGQVKSYANSCWKCFPIVILAVSFSLPVRCLKIIAEDVIFVISVLIDNHLVKDHCGPGNS